MSVPILVPEGESVVTLTSTSICESTAKSIVVVAIVVLSISILSIVVLTIVVLAVVVLATVVAVVVLAIVVLTIVVLAIVVAVVVAAVIIGGIAAAATVVGSPTTKQVVEEPFIPSVLPLFCLPPLPARVAGAGAASGKEEPGLPVLSLAFATFAARVASVDVAVVQSTSKSTSNCGSQDGGAEGTKTGANEAPVQSIVAREKPRVSVQGTERELLS